MTKKKKRTYRKTGRRAKPTALHLVQGTRSHVKNHGEEAEPELTLPPCPPELDPIATEHYAHMGTRLVALGIMSEIDGAAMAAYCASYSQWRRAEKVINDTSPVIRGVRKNSFVVNPWVRIRDRALGQMYRFMVEFGMTPSSRTRIAAEKPGNRGEQDPWAGRSKRA